jgi:hypothetical protein
VAIQVLYSLYCELVFNYRAKQILPYGEKACR